MINIPELIGLSIDEAADMDHNCWSHGCSQYAANITYIKGSIMKRKVILIDCVPL